MAAKVRAWRADWSGAGAPSVTFACAGARRFSCLSWQRRIPGVDPRSGTPLVVGPRRPEWDLESRLDINRAAGAVRGEVLNGVVLHAGVAGPAQRPKAPWLPEKRPTRGVACPLRCPPPRAATRIGPAENLGRFISLAPRASRPRSAGSGRYASGEPLVIDDQALGVKR